MKKYLVILCITITIIFMGCSQKRDDPKLISSFALDESLFIQGLEVNQNKNGDKALYVGLGLEDDSRIIAFDLKEKTPFEIKEKNKENENFFGEGITFGPKGLYQLTWKNEELYIRNPQNGEIIEKINYSGEGWGLAYDKDKNVFYFSNGTNYIYILDAETFEELDKFDVGVSNLNELEYANGFLFSNVWQEGFILKIDLKSKRVVKKYDFSKLCKNEKMSGDNVLNGIAHLKDNFFFISGKNWKKIYLYEL